MLSRVLFALGFLSSLVLSSAQGPSTYCTPVTVDAFSVVAASGNADTEGSMVFMANGTYPRLNYNITLPTAYNSNNVFFNILLTPNITNNTFVGLQSYGFTIALNGQFKNNSGPSGNTTYFPMGAAGVVNNIEFSNWLFDPRQRQVFTNVLQLNVSEVIYITEGTDSALTECVYLYTFNFLNPLSTPGTGANVVGDPQFKGLRGQSFQVHGVDGAVYNLISDKDMQLNTRFTFLEGPRPCPVMPSTGKVSAACWSHPGSYLSELALKTSGGDQLSIVSGEASQGFASVQLNGKNIALGSSVQLAYSDAATGSVSVENSHELTIRSGLFELVVENNDGFINLRSVSVSAANWPRLSAHGLLGQTWQNKRYGGKIKEIEGDVDDYLIEDDNMFGDSFLFNKFATASA